MKSLHVTLIFLAFFTLPHLSMAQGKKKANKQTTQWRYEIEAVGTGTQGSYQIKTWTYSKNAKTATHQAKKNAVHGIVFKGFPSKDGVAGQRALAQNPNIEQEKAEFFDDFFKDGGKYQKYVSLANHGAIGAGDRIKIGKEYKIGVIVSVNVAALRKDLEDAGIIKGLGSGF